MDKQDIEKYLRMLGYELQKEQITGEILLVGGAVMLLEVGNREVTKDIDAYFDAKHAAAIREAAATIAKREGLSINWLNDAVKGFFYTQPPNKRWAEYPGLRIYIPTLDYLLVMKVVAGRPQDIEDAKALIKKLQISTSQQVLELIASYTKQQNVEARVQYIVEELFEE
ncbi:MAG: DUF6036 family nucleotidyltransferase [Ktedonobacteraceae bacterium]